METLKNLVAQVRSRRPDVTEQEIFNIAREYLQTLLLKLIYRSKFGTALSFMGGTALRICYDLKRYSEDLDFALDGKEIPYRFSALTELLRKELGLLGFDISAKTQEEKVVQKAFFGFSGLTGALDLRRFRKEQKLHIKIEVDVRPTPLEEGERESFFVARFQEIFPILKHTLPTLFAGKVLAVLQRAYTRGRDYYDLIWYLSRKTELNLGYLNRTLKGGSFATESEAFEAVREKVNAADPRILLGDLDGFLDDPRETGWISRYRDLFEQLVAERKENPRFAREGRALPRAPE